MRKNKKLFFIFEFIIYLSHVIIEAGANSCAGGEKIFHRHYLVLNVLIRDSFAILVSKGKRLNSTNRWVSWFCKTGYYHHQDNKKTHYENTEKQEIKNSFLIHNWMVKLLNLLKLPVLFNWRILGFTISL